MISPVTSTSVATNGAELVAGSNPNDRKMNGSIDPASDPHITTPINAKNTVNPIKNQCLPYAVGVSLDRVTVFTFPGSATDAGSVIPLLICDPAGITNAGIATALDNSSSPAT